MTFFAILSNRIEKLLHYLYMCYDFQVKTNFTLKDRYKILFCQYHVS
jgi:hypothetical protein